MCCFVSNILNQTAVNTNFFSKKFIYIYIYTHTHIHSDWYYINFSFIISVALSAKSKIFVFCFLIFLKHFNVPTFIICFLRILQKWQTEVSLCIYNSGSTHLLISIIMHTVNRTWILSRCNSLSENHTNTNLNLVLILVSATYLPFCYFSQSWRVSTLVSRPTLTLDHLLHLPVCSQLDICKLCGNDEGFLKTGYIWPWCLGWLSFTSTLPLHESWHLLYPLIGLQSFAHSILKIKMKYWKLMTLVNTLNSWGFPTKESWLHSYELTWS